MLTFILALQAATVPIPAQAAIDPQTAKRSDIVVTSARLEEAERAWKACRKRNCPPDQEIHAALVHGENLFVAGDYAQAGSVIATTVNATRGAAARYPVAVGDLRRAQATIASHNGDPSTARQGMIYSTAALKAGLGDDDRRVLVQRLQTADSLMLREPTLGTQVGGPLRSTDSREGALRAYAAVARDAWPLGDADTEGRALLRGAALLTRFAAGDPRSYERRARRAVEVITARTDPRMLAYRQAALVLQARLDAADGDMAAVDRLVALVSDQPSPVPTLLYAPPIDWSKDVARRQSLARRAIAKIQAEYVDSYNSDQWIDIGFRIAADGRVVGAEVLRASDTPPGSWAGVSLASVQGRRYAYLAPTAAAKFRVERHSLTTASENVTGTRIETRTGLPRIAVTDLTDDARSAATTTALPAG